MTDKDVYLYVSKYEIEKKESNEKSVNCMNLHAKLFI